MVPINPVSEPWLLDKTQIHTTNQIGSELIHYISYVSICILSISVQA